MDNDLTTFWKVVIILLCFIIFAQTWKIYELENQEPVYIYRCDHAPKGR